MAKPSSSKAKKPTPAEVKLAREATQMTQKQLADRFGYSLSGWQSKEDDGPYGRSLSVGEFELLQLLGDTHPEFTLTSRIDESTGLPMDPDAAIMWKNIPVMARDAFCWMCAGKWILTLEVAEQGKAKPAWFVYLVPDIYYRKYPEDAFFALEEMGLLHRVQAGKKLALTPTPRGLNTYLKAVDEGQAREIK